jgi:Uma2 family endonuclease
MQSEDKNIAKEPDVEYGFYSYRDYLTWNMDEMVELIKGKVFKKAAAAPNRLHQRLSIHLASEFFQFLKGKTCEVYEAPFDVRFPTKSNKNEEIFTVVQPDICVICDPKKLDAAGCLGAPDLIAEILSPGNNQKELKIKYELYEEVGVLEYWIIYPTEQSLIIHSLVSGKYHPSRPYTIGDTVESKCIQGFQIDLTELFSE